MAVLVTRPAPDNQRTAAALLARGYRALLSPMLRFEALAFQDDGLAYDGIILTSANAVRALVHHPAMERLVDLPTFTVGEQTAEAARRAGFRNVISAKGDAEALNELIVETAVAGKIKKNGAALCYFAGADRARDLSGDLSAHGFVVTTHTVYRMAAVEDLSPEVSSAFASGGIDAVLHYSRRTARAFVDAARIDGVEISALALPQCCISDAVAAVLREAGAAQVIVARTPDEDAVIETLNRTIQPSLR
ncbi:uroporphyrinogen-III synthase [Bradyrhizobium sp. SYSU BS000235]|uniref:uroporphyrinogen-III synthase n=1 Tax=Bradyrhizobium sp. SYSU BS000235 TaxID=3411332 RepID=UPI003C795027